MGGSLRNELDNKSKSMLQRAEVQARFPYLVEVTNPDFGTFRFVNSNENITFEGNVYEASYFNLKPPSRNGNTVNNASIEISAIDGEWIRRIRETNKRSTLTFTAVMIHDNESGEMVIEPIEKMSFLVTDANWNESIISWTLVYDDKMSILIPCDVAGVTNCVGCAD